LLCYKIEHVWPDVETLANADNDEAVFCPIDGFMRKLAESTRRLFPDDPDMLGLAQDMAGLDLAEFSSSIVLNLKDRREYLSTMNFEATLNSFIADGKSLMAEIGHFSDINVEYPILNFLRKTRHANMVIAVVLNLIMTGLLFLSCFVIYSISLKLVDRNIFQMAVSRVLGLTKRNMIEIQVFNTFLISILGITLGKLFIAKNK
jgi:hypothetical protein